MENDELIRLLKLRSNILEASAQLEILNFQKVSLEKLLSNYKNCCNHMVGIKQFNLDTNEEEVYCLFCNKKLVEGKIDKENIVDFSCLKHDTGCLSIKDKSSLVVDILTDIKHQNPNLSQEKLIKQTNKDIKNMDSSSEFKILKKLFDRI